MKMKIRTVIGAVLCMVICCALFVGCSKNKDKEQIEIKPATTVNVGSATELVAAAQYVGEEYSQYTIKLTQDIDLSGVEWKPIGMTLKKAFYGTFDGDGHTISGLKVKGWDENGKPLYVAKQIIGWLDDGTPVYRSSEIIKVNKGKEVSDGKYEVTGSVREGDNADPSFQAIDDGKGVFETDAAYGSVGLFGYTFGATIKNLNVSGADISFYASGPYAYAGIISGYDVASRFDGVNVVDSQIAVSSICEREVKYYDNYGTPKNFDDVNVSKQYIGGVVGYTKSNTGATNVATVFSNVSSKNFVFDNTNYYAYYDAGFEIVDKDAAAKMVISADAKGDYAVTQITNSYAPIQAFPVYLYLGGVSGYVYGADINNVIVDGVNKATFVSTDSHMLTGYTSVTARSLYAGGIAGGMYSTKSNNTMSTDIFINGISWRSWINDTAVGLVYDKATVGGAYAIIGKSSVKNAAVKNFFSEVGGGDQFDNVCIGGAIGYVDDYSDVNQISVDGAYMYTTYSGSEKLGSILGGAVGVLRNSSLTDADVKNVDFEISACIESTYMFANALVSQTYGNSVFNNAKAKNVRIQKSRTEYYSDNYEKVTPYQEKNNYVNENGFTSVRLYYANDKMEYSNVYVTVYGELIPVDANNNLLIEEDIYVKADLAALEGYTDGSSIEIGKYYVYEPQDDRFIFIGKDTYEDYRKYNSNALYATKETVYRVEFSGNFVGGQTYYEYIENQGVFKPTLDTARNESKTYYIVKNNESVISYYLDIKVYSESGNLIICDKKNVNDDNDDVLAEARYVLTKEDVENAVKTVVCGDKEYALANSEIFINKFFQTGTGFIADKNGFKIMYFDSALANRNFAKYILVSGRPNVDMSTIIYG